ncbi:MSMEG_0565 family glycosyltransferase [Aeromicrobium fastidiosum]|uniref:MSMEG_0565 family glycosyltransferase n=1 Tax=Aeromicrobium fastidiosum TaxID=52699 RepID=A0A641AH77_9ACTN|nr:MSMEG_0565 family glycosyltransferase [Aeromicrobium fastidiosum]KAA1372466.1 MSMEG_0565 family glycosyltransferase [Aeromicrobium fastidiosum]MBP2391456.1 glycosyltransferase-like protein [Aeromicrobium fastidiosum]
MRIALLTYSTKPRGGVVHTLALAEALSRAGAEVDVWTLGRGGDATFYRAVDPSVGVHAVPFPEQPGEDVGARIQRSIVVLRDAFRPDAYDIVHAQDCISANAALPCLRTIHHLDTFTTPELVACHERAVVDPVGRICVSESVAAEVKAGWGLQPTVIPNGVDAGRFARAAGPDGAAGRAAWHDRLGPYVLALGGIEPRKGSIDLLEAYALMRRRCADVRLVFAGGETLFDYRDYRAAFERRAAELSVDHEMLGVVDEGELASLVAGAAAMAFVSTKEGFGLAAMEALAAGVPVVARDLPVLREVFGDAVRFASEPMAMAGALAAVLSDPPDPQIGRDLAASYTWEAAARAHLDFYAAHLT